MDIFDRVREAERERQKQDYALGQKLLSQLNSRLYHEGLFQVNSVCYFLGKVRGINTAIVKTGDYFGEMSLASAEDFLKEKIKIQQSLDEQTSVQLESGTVEISEPITREDFEEMGKLKLMSVSPTTRYIFTPEEVFGRNFELHEQTAKKDREEDVPLPTSINGKDPSASVSLFKQRMMEKRQGQS